MYAFHLQKHMAHTVRGSVIVMSLYFVIVIIILFFLVLCNSDSVLILSDFVILIQF